MEKKAARRRRRDQEVSLSDPRKPGRSGLSFFLLRYGGAFSAEQFLIAPCFSPRRARSRAAAAQAVERVVTPPLEIARGGHPIACDRGGRAAQLLGTWWRACVERCRASSVCGAARRQRSRHASTSAERREGRAFAPHARLCACSTRYAGRARLGRRVCRRLIDRADGVARFSYSASSTGKERRARGGRKADA